MTPFEFVVAALAAWRLAYMLTVETGPWKVFTRVRRIVGVVEYDGARDIPNPGSAAELFSCIFCASVWAAAVAVAAVVTLPLWVAGVPAASGAALLVQRAVVR